MSSYMERYEEKAKEDLVRVRRAVARGMQPEEAVNLHAQSTGGYAAALKEYGLKPVIPD